MSLVVGVSKGHKTPGPKYGAPSTIGYENTDLRMPRAPAYTMGQPLRQQQQRALQVPGPKYDLSKVTRHGPVKIPGVLLLGPRPKERGSRIPGPGTYNVIPCIPAIKTSTPMYSIGWRRDGRTKPSRTPAPNKYSLGTTIGNGAPDMPSAPMYSIQGRRDRPAGRRVASHASPGPARYSAVPLEKTLPQPPRPVMFGRHEDGLQRRRRGTPGPNAYQPGAASLSSRYPSAPQFSIAGRFPPSSMVYTTEDLAPDWDC